MNFLAHAFLSGSDPEILTGNLIGDFVKGKQMKIYGGKIQNGIHLHREIDGFTDHHKITLKSKQRLFPLFRHYSAVIVDMFYDHFLAVNWNKYHQEDLKDFTEKVYKILVYRKRQLPESFQYMLQHMQAQNWLYHYKDLEGINRALTGMARRTKFNSSMEHATKELENHYKEYQKEFEQFFPDIISFTSTFEFVEPNHLTDRNYE